MPGVTYSLADYRTGGPILDLPVQPGATWAAMLNRADTLSCTVSMQDVETRALDLRAASEPRKTVLFARTDADAILAWGLVDDDRVWDEDAQTVSLTAKGVWASHFGSSIIAPAAALTDYLVDDAGLSNPALDTILSGLGLGSIGRYIVAQRLTWPGSPTYTLPAIEPGTHEETYPFVDLKTVGSALTDITNREKGVDFAFDAQRGSDGLHLEYVMRAGTEAAPGIGVNAGGWTLGGNASPVTGLQVADNGSELGSAAWLVGGRSSGKLLMARALNPALITADGFPPLDVVDKSRNNVMLQETLNGYAREAADYASRVHRSLSFSVRGDVAPLLGSYRPGDVMTLGVRPDHKWLTADIPVRITSISGDETGLSIKVGCVTI